ncbi:MAG: hypothetical protein FWG17_03020 [Desulfovibrionaceae bacterium]|nr:hypothetical protein [Desulfovibrionaceae bacterium]
MAGKGKQAGFRLTIGAKDAFSGVFGRFSGSLGRAQKDMRNLGRAWRNLGRAGDGLLSTFSGIGKGLALTFGTGGGLFTLTKHLGGAVKESANAASRVGMHLKTWQEYAYAAERAGISTGDLENALNSLQERALGAARGDADSTQLLKSLGLDPQTVEGRVQASSVVLSKLADRIKALKEAGEDAKAAGLAKHLGLSSMLPLLEKGSGHLEEMRLRAHELNLVFGEESVETSGSFLSSFTDILSMLRGFGRSMFQIALPAISKLMEKFGEWIETQRQLIGTGDFAAWIEGLNIDELWKDIENFLVTLKELAQGVNRGARFFGGWGDVMKGLALFMGGRFLFSLLGVFKALSPFAPLLGGIFKASFLAGSGFTALSKAFWALQASSPLAFLTILSTIAYAIYRNWDGFVAYFKNLWKGVQEAFSENFLLGILKTLWDFNPLRLILKGMNELIAYFTGFNFFESLGKRWGEQLTAWIPDRVKSFLGIGSKEPALAQSGEGVGSGALASRELAATRSEHVERQENRVILVPPDDWGMQVSGPAGGVRQDGASMQIGYLGYGY